MTTPKNPSAVALGRLGGAAGAGKPKRYSAEEIARRTARIMKEVEKRRNAKGKK